MIYTMIGRAVVKGVRLYLRQRYGPTYAPKPVLAGAVVAAVVGVAVVAGKQSNGGEPHRGTGPCDSIPGVAEPFRMPAGVTVEAVDWLPSGARSGLVRVRGRG